MVMYSSDHNHDKALKHVTLSQIERQRIAGMISAGIEFDEILDSIRDNLSPTEITRLHLLSRKDIVNISQKFHRGKVRASVKTETCDQEYEMNLTVPQSFDDFDCETVLASPANSNLGAGEMNMWLKAGCGASNDKNKNLKEIQELINTISGSLVGDPHHDVIAIAKEGLKAIVAQITAASLRHTS